MGLKHLTGYGTSHCFLNSLPLAFHFLSVLFYLTTSQRDPYQLWLMDLSLLLNLSIVVFRRAVFCHQPFSYVLSMTSYQYHLIISTHMLMTPPYTLPLCSPKVL